VPRICATDRPWQVFLPGGPSDAVQGNDLSGFDLSDLKNGRATFTAATDTSVKAAMFVYKPTKPGWGAAATAAKKAAP